MAGLPKTKSQTIDNSLVPAVSLSGIHGVIVPTLFGQADKAYKVSTVDQLKRLFGANGSQSPFYPQLRRAIVRGTTLYIVRLIATGATAATYVWVGPKVTVTTKDVGSWANNKLGIEYFPVASGQNKLIVRYPANPALEETFVGTSLDSLIATVNANSQRIVITTTAGYTEPPATAGVPVYLTGGTEGAFADDAAKTTAVNALLTKFDDVVGLTTVFAMGVYTAQHIQNLKAYAEGRGDLIGLFEIDPASSAATATTFATGLNFSSSYLAGYRSSLMTAYSVEDQTDVAGPCLLDVAAAWSYSDTVSGNIYKAPAGGTRGVIPNIKSFANNLLSPANVDDADNLATAGINIVGNDPDFGACVWGADTFLKDTNGSAFNQIHVRRLLIDMARKLTPLFKSIQFEPMDPISWRQAYLKALPILQNYEANRAIYTGWSYIGDQEASVVSDAKYNQVTDLEVGTYKILIAFTPIGYIRDILFTIQVNNLQSLFQVTASEQ